MHYVYVLKSGKSGNMYVGATHDIDKRLKAHNEGNNYSTKAHIPYYLVYYEAYLDKMDAMNREYKLKHHGSSIGHLKNRLKNSLSKLEPPKGRG